MLTILNQVTSFNAYYNTDIGRRFARTTRLAATTLLKGTIEALNTGNEMEFASAYPMYAGVPPSNVGARFDVLRKLITITYNQAAVATITNSELQSLSSRLQTNSSVPRADTLLRTVCVQAVGVAGMEIDMYGGDPLVITGNNTNMVEAQQFVFNYTRPTGLMVSCTVPFVYHAVGQPLRPQTNCAFLNSDVAGAYAIVIPMGTVRIFTFSATTPHLIDPASTLIKAAHGYERAKVSRLFDARLYANLDECLSAQHQIFRENEPVSALSVMLLEAYEDISLALSMGAIRY